MRLLRLGGWASHRHLLVLALPMVVANISTPLVGMVDTAVLGHMQSPAILAGSSVAAFIFTQLVWVCGFLRMSTTGESAQAFGQSSQKRKTKALWQSLLIAVVLGAGLFLLKDIIYKSGVQLGELDTSALSASKQYFDIRAYSLPFAIANLVLVGWLIGQQQTKTVMWVQIAGNALNIGLNLVLVFKFDMGVKGVASASVCAEIVMCLLYFMQCHQKLLPGYFDTTWFSKSALLPLISVNSHMLMRNLILQICIGFMTLQGARYGVVAAGVNAILMQFFALVALGLDGIAFAVEAQVGKAKGQKSRVRLSQCCVQGLAWSCAVAAGYALLFLLFGHSLSKVFTEHSDILSAFEDYYWIVVFMPLVGHWCFLFDGVAVGLSEAKAMRDSMFISALCGFLPFWWLLHSQQNMSLWFAMLAFLSMRGVLLGSVIYHRYFMLKSAL